VRHARRLPALLVLLPALALAATPAGAELRQVQAEGVAPGAGGRPAGSAAPREAALRAALREAVLEVAVDVAQTAGRATHPARLAELLGDDPLPYTPRYRIVEDRGEGPPRRLESPAASTEYALVVEASVDVERVREALGVARDGPARGAGGRAWLVLEGVDSWQAVEAARAAAAASPGVESVVPAEFQRGTAVLQVRGRIAPRRLLDDLMARAGSETSFVPLGIDGARIGVRVRTHARPAPVPGAAVRP